MKLPILGAFEAPSKDEHRVGPLQTIHAPMRRFKDEDEVDYVIVGLGSAGGILLHRLARAGFNVVGLESGTFWDTERDWVSDEAGSHQLYWTEPRVTGGSDLLALGLTIVARVWAEIGTLSRVHTTPSSLGLQGVHRGWGGRGMADRL